MSRSELGSGPRSCEPAAVPADDPAGSPDRTGPDGADLADAVEACCLECRTAGLRVPTDAAAAFAEAVRLLVPVDGIGLRRLWASAARATLVTRPEDRAALDAALERFWAGRASPGGGPAITDETQTGPTGLGPEVDVPAGHRPEPAAVAVVGDLASEAPDLEAGAEPGGEVSGLQASATERLRHKDFAACSSAELDEARRLMADLDLSGVHRRGRRRVPRRRGRGPLDLRRTTRAALHTDTELLRLHRTRRSRQPRRVVVLCDVSGSMDPYVRALLRFVQAAVGSAGTRRSVPVEAFTLGTRLTRLTRELAARDPDVALARGAAAVADWSGGTRLGQGLRTFNDDWGAPGLARGAVVVILSDGWDRGDPRLLADEMGRLHRLAHRVIWVNPLLAVPGYQPLTRGMAAALPHVDAFVPGHNLEALEALAADIRRAATGPGQPRPLPPVEVR